MGILASLLSLAIEHIDKYAPFTEGDITVTGDNRGEPYMKGVSIEMRAYGEYEAFVSLDDARRMLKRFNR